MLRRNRIPEKDTEFNNYIYRTTAALLNGTPPAWQRLRLTENDKNQWIGFMNQWDDLYPKHVNPGLRTRTVTREKNRVKKEFTTFAQPLLTQMSGSYATEGDRLTFNLRPKVRPYRRRGKIEDIPSVHIKNMGGTSLLFRVRKQNQEGRRGKHPLADVLEVRYVVLNEQVPEVSIEQCTETYFSKKIYFFIRFPANAIGKCAYFYFRWRNFSKEENSGVFSSMLKAFVA